MEKNPQKMKITEKDKKILIELQKDCRQPLKDLSKKVGLPSSTVYLRIKKMEEAGVIRKYAAVLRGSSLGVPIVVYILINMKPPTDKRNTKTHENILQKIADLPGVQDVFEITGRWDAILKVRGKDLPTIHSEIIDKIRLMEGVTDTETLVTMRKQKESPDIFF